MIEVDGKCTDSISEWRWVLDEALNFAGASANLLIIPGIEDRIGIGCAWITTNRPGIACEAVYDMTTITLTALSVDHNLAELIAHGKVSVDVGNPDSLNILGSFLDNFLGPVKGIGIPTALKTQCL